MRRLAIPALGALVVLGTAACAGEPSPGDFKSEAEDFIEGDLSDDPGIGGVEFTDAECQEPAATAVGTTYTCTASGADGTAYSFGVSIVGERELRVDSIDPPLPETTPTSTPPTTPTTASG